jgi:tellurite resistance protein TerC
VEASLFTWLGLIAFIAVAFVVDFFFFQKDHHTPPSLKRAGVWSAIWIGVALLFGAVLYATEGSGPGGEFLTGYLLERSLSLDNVFVFALIFGAMAVPVGNRQDVLEIGIILALVLRAVFIVLGAALVESLSIVLYLFGAILLYTGIRMALHRGEDEDVDPDKNIGVRILKKFMPVTDGYREGNYTVRIDGKRHATPLLAVVAAVATADVIFAVDSIPAIFGITTDTFIVFAANAFALLGLRALFALLEGAQDRFVYLPLGLSSILIFIGVKMLIEDLYHIPVAASLAFIVLALALSVLLSLRKPPPGGTNSDAAGTGIPPGVGATSGDGGTTKASART